MVDEQLVERIEALTGLNRRAATCVALSLEDRDANGDWSAADIVHEATALGYEFEKRDVKGEQGEQTFAAEVSMDPATVLAEIYENSPRVLSANMPAIGRAPTEIQEHVEELDLPEDVKALLVKVDMFEGKATLWLRDEANEVDRPIGPIDLTRYTDGNALHQAFEALLKRLPKVLAADFN